MALHMKTKKYVKRVLLSLLIFVLSFSLLSMIASIIFYHTAFPRSDDPSEYALTYADIDASAYPAQRIAFPSGDNMLTGYYYACEDPAALVVIAAGFRESGAAHLSEMMAFFDEGYSVLCYDATGVGESEGSGTAGLSQPALDLHAALDYVSAETALSDLPVLLYGFSAGGYAAATCATGRQVRAAAIVSGYDSPVSLMCHTARSYVGMLADIEYPFLLLENHLVFGREGNGSASAYLTQADKPIAVYEGADDEVVPERLRLSHTMDFSDPDLTLTVCTDAPRSRHDNIRFSEKALAVRETTSGDIYAANALDEEFIGSLLNFFRASL